MIPEFEKKIRVEKDVHRVMMLDERIKIIHRENDLLYNNNVSMYADMNRHDINLLVPLKKNQHKK